MTDEVRRAAAVPRITAAEQDRRREHIEEARHSSALEGGTSSPRARELQEQYIRGEIATVEELVARTVALHKRRG